MCLVLQLPQVGSCDSSVTRKGNLLCEAGEELCDYARTVKVVKAPVGVGFKQGVDSPWSHHVESRHICSMMSYLQISAKNNCSRTRLVVHRQFYFNVVTKLFTSSRGQLA
jgi:hypothetical protein